MTMRKGNLIEVSKIADELKSLIALVVEEIDNQTSYELDGDRYRHVDKYPDGPAPDHERHPGYAKSTAALKRRSLDLTRALADLRRSNG